MKAPARRARLSGGFIAELEPRAEEYVVWDRGLPSFGVRVYPGGRKVFIVRQRIDGRQATLLIGRADAVPFDVARQEARRLIVDVGDGEDPAAEVRERRSVPTFEAFAEEYFTRWSPKWKPSTQVSQRKLLDRWIKPAFGGLFVDEIGSARVLEWFELVSARSPGAANRALEVFKHMMRKAEDWGYRPRQANPFATIKRNPRRKMNRFLTHEEMARLGGVLDQLGVKYPGYAAFVRFLLLSGLRRSEAMALTWRNVGPGWIKLEDSKTGPKTLQLGQGARAVLKALPRTHDKVFLGANGPLTTKGVDWFWDVARRKAELRDLRMHDLRHNFASHAVMAGEPLPAVSKMLGHAHIQNTARYAHLDDAVVIAAAEKVGAIIGGLVGGRPEDVRPCQIIPN